MFGLSARLSLVFVVVISAVLAGCGSRALNRAPVEDRGARMGQPESVVLDPATLAVQQLPGFENAGKPGYYTVKPGDTLIRIGLEHGQVARDIARWSNLENPNRIEVGQVLRVVPPAAVINGANGVVAKPVTSGTVTPVTGATAPAATASSSAPAPVGDDDIDWIWPTNGAVLAGFDEVKNKGLDIGGVAGDPVVAAADGRVVYVGAGLRGYGNLIILKHNNTFLTAYAHNKTLLIKEDQAVRKGQKIAEMGSSDADRVKLHFEVRRQGKPVDPAKYLPPR
ncbi:MAG: peptidoglycan DD-metalloendopeptidase family protein [Gammaproteobacteria bacterium]|uniref:peptidoglycan DD-metalloendopeptidase family protein n=1 Tax=Rhodoferax sp. TaxID=50421 RepID=UPI0017D81482|nr:peptidoglycan DD-metalloendopeptidase family protein [Rhodoferax sp.]MBU3899779.1 peptidoglycan DD-metalloendopeptidase family protein [Gammaproteobacteria bacterium]MBA3058741.1 peptidoglycan DD-metalloendopeptidase family protein [Rhodoferax sp.]MBU3997045.1 peptidoglycan DD-metalloendopeptidase family protein [Gammaproteobacteria bacterium]MBU4019043.1 peptidoglycan DD-metalloendopeptidase family protein [Gammaproteobacteria bacterium]MBU4078762.1 peptidoglycan DD-metalloendopeptidase fa